MMPSEDAPRRRSSAARHFKAVYIPIDAPARDVNLPPISHFGPAAHTAAIQKLFAKDKTELERSNGGSFPPSTEAGVAAGWKGLGFPRLTVITDSAASAGVDGGARMARNVAATKILTGPELAKTHRVVPVHGPALILAEGDDDSSEEPQERDFTTEDLKKLLAAYEEASINGDEAME